MPSSSISIHALLAESDAGRYCLLLNISISIHALLAESDLRLWLCLSLSSYFYPRSPCGERRGHRWIECRHPLFLSTLSLRRATQSRGSVSMPRYHFYPRSPCGERPYYMQWDITDTVISIHALLAESDKDNPRCPKAAPNFYPRSPCGERLLQRHLTLSNNHFYPRSPCGERPLAPQVVGVVLVNFYPRSPCGERRGIIWWDFVGR